MTALTAIIDALTAENPNQIIVDADGAGFTMIDTEFPKDASLHVWFDRVAAEKAFANLVPDAPLPELGDLDDILNG